MNTLTWLYAHELPTGGIAAWPGSPAYPEVTGYLIPTLYDWGAGDLALRCAEWLLTIQDPSGGWPGREGALYAFDTAAIIEGMDRAYQETGRVEFAAAKNRAAAWLATLRTDRGFYRSGPGREVCQYALRINGILGDDPDCWMVHGSDRCHYIAYALEGYLRLGYEAQVKAALGRVPYREDGLAYFELSNWRERGGSDVIATAQLAILGLRLGLDMVAQVEAVRRAVHPNGGVPQAIEVDIEMSWGAKFYLDMEREAGNGIR